MCRQAAETENGEFLGIGIGGRRKEKVKVLLGFLGMGRIISPKVLGEQGIYRKNDFTKGEGVQGTCLPYLPLP